jgi:hypothetical protein
MARSSNTITNARPYAPIPSPSIVTHADQLPILADSIAVAPSRSLSSTPKNHIETILSTSTTPTFNWIENHAIHYPFPITNDSNEMIDVVEYQTTGTLTASFLNADAKSHTVKLTVDERDIERIKALVKTSPDFVEETFHWPFDVNGIATFTSKQNLSAEFEYLYDARGKNPDDVDEDDKMSPSRLNNGSKVLVEHTPTTWSGKKTKNDVEPPFGNGCTLKLQSILLLEDKYNFQSPRKRRRMK